MGLLGMLYGRTCDKRKTRQMLDGYDTKDAKTKTIERQLTNLVCGICMKKE